MRTILGTVLLTFVLPGPLLVAQDGVDPTRLYGRIETSDGSVYEGFLRWDGNEAGWYDVLHATKRIPERNRRDADRLGWEPAQERERFEIFGIGISFPSGRSEIGSTAQSGLRFGHVSTLEVTGSSRARVLLRTGEEVEFVGGGDLGTSVDEILVEDVRRGQVELEWRDVRVIDFMPAPAQRSAWGERLYGTLVTRSGARYQGYLVWDMDELFTSDILDGEEDGRDVEIPFSAIASIERYGSGGARVRLADGGDVVLRGSNDVNDDNRDIMVADPALGEIRVEWDALDRVEFATPPEQAAALADGSGRLRGTVRARGGETHTGWIRWDNDEEYGWELLDGSIEDGVELDVEFAVIRSIERVGYDASRVTLRDGRALELSDSNDVDEGNRGVYVERDDGTLVLVPWDRFERVDFED